MMRMTRNDFALAVAGLMMLGLAGQAAGQTNTKQICIVTGGSPCCLSLACFKAAKAGQCGTPGGGVSTYNFSTQEPVNVGVCQTVGSGYCTMSDVTCCTIMRFTSLGNCQEDNEVCTENPMKSGC